MVEPYTERNQQVMEDLKQMTASDVARKHGISRQRVGQIVEAMGGYPAGHPAYRDYSKIDPLLGTMPDTWVAEFVGEKLGVVYHRRVMLGIQAYYEARPESCEKCKTHHYARGMCKACYARWLRRR